MAHRLQKHLKTLNDHKLDEKEADDGVSKKKKGEVANEEQKIDYSYKCIYIGCYPI